MENHNMLERPPPCGTGLHRVQALKNFFFFHHDPFAHLPFQSSRVSLYPSSFYLAGADLPLGLVARRWVRFRPALLAVGGKNDTLRPGAEGKKITGLSLPPSIPRRHDEQRASISLVVQVCTSTDSPLASATYIHRGRWRSYIPVLRSTDVTRNCTTYSYIVHRTTWRCARVVRTRTCTCMYVCTR